MRFKCDVLVLTFKMMCIRENKYFHNIGILFRKRFIPTMIHLVLVYLYGTSYLISV